MMVVYKIMRSKTVAKKEVKISITNQLNAGFLRNHVKKNNSIVLYQCYVR